MAVWVDGGTTAFFGSGSWVTDMGLYTGPSPLQPPAVTSGLSGSSFPEIDFYVMLPNPADTTDVTIVGDGSYAAQVWDAYRDINTGTPPPATFVGFSTFHVGATTSPLWDDPMPAGAHLYVAAYSVSGVPVNPPEFYVPPSYAAGGVAAFETLPGQWSAWQTGLTRSQNVRAGTGSTEWASGTGSTDATVSVGSDSDLTTMMTSAVGTLDGIASHTAASPLLNIFNSKTLPSFADPNPNSTVNLNASQWGSHYVAPTPFNPNPLGSMVRGVDYDRDPQTGHTFEYASTSPAETHWGYLRFGLGGAFTSGPSGDAAGIGNLSSVVHVEIMSAPIPDGTHGVQTGTSLATLTASTADGGSVDRAVLVTSALGSATQFTTATTADVLYDDAGNSAASPDFALSAGGSYAWDVVFNRDNSIGLGADFHWTTSGWRYWVLGLIVSTEPGNGYWGVPM